ncbi:hypothetical protein V5O48_009528 [Marasmius crinis-equi]|uniref:Cytochrome P450 n=1 Tax=Marasmius crinis-equi TaxID=585013 RepID=A0ABR3FB25_9AGAR
MGLITYITLRAIVVAAIGYVVLNELIPLYKKRRALRNIAGPPSASWWRGNWGQIFNKDGWRFKKHIIDTYGSLLKVNALFGDQQLYIADPLAITTIFQTDRPLYDVNHYHLLRSRLCFGIGLVGTIGEIHAKQRKLLAPFFSTNFLRYLLPNFYPFAYELCDHMEELSKQNDGVINMHKMMSIAALEYVGAGLGYKFDGLKGTSMYNDNAKILNPLTFKLSTFRMFLPWMVKLGPAWFRRRLIDWLPWNDAKAVKKVIYTMDDVAKDILAYRRQAYEDGQINGRDILSAILRYNDEVGEDEKISDYEMLSHITTTLFAGHETTAGSLSRILHQMAILPDQQERLRKEVSEARAKDGDLDFDKLMQLPFLDAVCKEVLRCYPPVDQVYRTSNSHSTIPLLFPVESADGKNMINVVHVEPKTELIISIISYNRNKLVWGADAEEWNPERWLEPTRKSVTDAKLPAQFANMMTFTLGGKSCIGYKFAEMEMKLILTMLMERFEFSVSPKEPIFWAMGGSITPIIKGSNKIEPTLPLKVTPVKRKTTA